MIEQIQTQAIQVVDRDRKDFGNIDELAASIKENGVIQPICLTTDDQHRPVLLAGERRLRAFRHLHMDTLVHGVHYIWRDDLVGETDENKLRRKSIELEENLKRKDMAWPEVVEGKRKLMELMQKIHGASTAGPPTAKEQLHGEKEGFGVRKMAAMLGESPALVSQDLKLAEAIQIVPQLKNVQNKSQAMAKVEGIIKQFLAKKAGTPPPPPPVLIYKVVVTCKDEQQQKDLLAEMAGRGLKVEALIAN